MRCAFCDFEADKLTEAGRIPGHTLPLWGPLCRGSYEEPLVEVDPMNKTQTRRCPESGLAR